MSDNWTPFLNRSARETFLWCLTTELNLFAERFRASMQAAIAAAVNGAWQDARLSDSSAPPDVLRPVTALQSLPALNAGGGVYFLVAKGRVVYVGQSVNVLSRVGTHLESKVFDQVFYLPLPESEYDVVESAFIRWLRPSLNANPGPNADLREAQAALARLGIKTTADELTAGRREVNRRQRRRTRPPSSPRPRQNRKFSLKPTMPRTKPLAARTGGEA